MDYKNIIIVICYAAASILNFLISSKVFKTMLEYACVTQDEITKFMSQQRFPSLAGKNSMHRSSIQNRKRAAMLNYLLEHTQNRDEIKELFALYEKSSWSVGISMLIFMLGLMLKNQIIMFSGIAVYLIGNIVIFFMLSAFKKRNPLTDAEIEALEAKRGAESSKQFIPAKVFVTVASIIPIIALILVLGDFRKTADVGTEPQNPLSYNVTSTLYSPDKFGISAFLDERGFWTERQIAHYHDFEAEKFTNVFASRKDDNSFEYYEHNGDKAAQALFSKIIEDYSAQDKIIDDTHYIYEDEKEFIFVSREGNTVIYAYSYDGGADIKEALTSCGIYNFE